MSANGISTLATKELRQKAKLDLAATKRAADGNPRATYDITQLPTQFNDDSVINNPNLGGLVIGRPWIDTTTPFTFYEAFGTTNPLSTTQYVSGNKIYAYSSTYDVPDYQNTRVVVNDIEVLNADTRGHHVVLLDSYGNVISTTRYDTYDPSYAAQNNVLLSNAIAALATGTIIVITVYDASSLVQGLRTAIQTHFGSTNTNIWNPSRTSQIFIGVKI
jgi:hypothetical protein